MANCRAWWLPSQQEVHHFLTFFYKSFLLARDLKFAHYIAELVDNTSKKQQKVLNAFYYLFSFLENGQSQLFYLFIIFLMNLP